MALYGIPVTIVNAISVLYINSKSAILSTGIFNHPFEASTRVSVGWCFSSIPLRYTSWLPYDEGQIRYLVSGVETHPRRSRRYPPKVLNDLDFADNIAVLESTMARAQTQLTSTASAAKNTKLEFVPNSNPIRLIFNLRNLESGQALPKSIGLSQNA